MLTPQSVHFYTSCSLSYLNRARVLADSIKRHHPQATLWLVLTDKAPDGMRLDMEAEDFDHMLSAEDMFGERTEAWLFKHDIVEACTAVKGAAAEHILSQSGCEALIYLDPDTVLFNPLDPVLEALETHSIVLTPHQIDPDAAGQNMAIIDNEITSLAYGAYNLGFLGLRNDAEARRFCTWWAARLQDWCYDQRDIGLFVDQKWCDLVPCFFDNVRVLRDPGCNVASWNLSQRSLSFDSDGTARVNGDHLLRFFHFTKLGKIGDVMTQRYARDNIEVYELWWWYRNEVRAKTDPDLPDRWWHYGHFEDGTPIPKAARVLYRDRRDLQSTFPNPRALEEPSLFTWLKDNTDCLETEDTSGFQPAAQVAES